MDPNEEFEELEDLDVNPDATEEIIDDGGEETFSDYPESTGSKTGYKGKKYHADRINELDEKSEQLKEKVETLKDEKSRDWKLKDSNNKEPVKADGSNTRLKTQREKFGDNAKLARAKAQEKINKAQRMKAKLDRVTDVATHPLEAAKEAAEDKAKDIAKKTGKAAAKGAVNAAKATGRLVAQGGKMLVSLLSNPYVLAAVVAAALLFIIFFMLFSKASDGDLEPEGYFDTTCDFNLTSVTYSCNGTSKIMGIKEYVLSIAYGEMQKNNLSEAAIKALMIITKTNALANGNYDSSGDKAISISGSNCNAAYENVYETLADEQENKTKQKQVKVLENYYNEIANYLFISESYKSEITELGSEDALEFNDNIIQKLVSTNKDGYEEILQEIYAVEDGESDKTITVTNSNPSIFVGDSRTVGMKNSVSELNDNNTIAEGSKRYDWFVNTAINSINSKINNGNSYNIISWMGVNDIATNASSVAEKYFNKYKELAQGSWSKHTIYVVKVGPVVDSKTYYVDNAQVNEFNDRMKELINNANISNLKYIDLSYSINSYDAEGLHYGQSDYQKIYNDIKAKVTSTKTLSKVKALFNNAEYCTYYRYKNDNCEVGWWYPIGESGSFNKGAILSGAPALLDTGTDNWGWRSDPFTGARKYHSGSDLWANQGMNVIAVRGGTIVTAIDGFNDYSGNKDGYGNQIVIDHGDGFFTRYGHLQKGSVSKYSSVGMTVSQGQIIALSGNSGRSTGPHLHFEVREGGPWGTSLNPFDYISTSNPRPAGNCNNYTADKSGVCKALKDLGFSDNAVAGLMVNIKAETWYFDFDPNAYVANDNGGPSMGLIMWHDVFACANYDVCSAKNSGYTCNASALKCFCQENNLEWNSVACQTKYLKKYIDDHANVYDFDAAKTIYDPNASAHDIASQFCIKLERPANKYTNCPQRASSYASDMLNFVKNGCKD